MTATDHPIARPEIPVYLSDTLATQDFVGGIAPRIGSQYMRAVAVDGLPIEYRWHTRAILPDPEKARSMLDKTRRKWRSKIRGWKDQIMRTETGPINLFAQEMAVDAEEAMGVASSGDVQFCVYNTVVLCFDDREDRLDDATALIVSTLKRLPQQDPSPEKYPFNQILTTLQEGGPEAPPTLLPKAPGAAGAEVPADFKPQKNVALPATAKEALVVSQAWMTEKHVPAPGKDGRVPYTFIGDAVRWMIAPATSGRPESATSMIVIKPQMTGLDTNLLVTTDRRAYYLRLISKSEEYLARVAFGYPEAEALRWKTHLLQEQQRKEELEASRVSGLESVENLYLDYHIMGGDDNMRPMRVIDDGRKTFIQMTPNAANREAPVLVVVGPDGPEMVNYRVKGDKATRRLIRPISDRFYAVVN